MSFAFLRAPRHDLGVPHEATSSTISTDGPHDPDPAFFFSEPPVLWQFEFLPEVIFCCCWKIPLVFIPYFSGFFFGGSFGPSPLILKTKPGPDLAAHLFYQSLVDREVKPVSLYTRHQSDPLGPPQPVTW